MLFFLQSNFCQSILLSKTVLNLRLRKYLIPNRVFGDFFLRGDYLIHQMASNISVTENGDVYLFLLIFPGLSIVPKNFNCCCAHLFRFNRLKFLGFSIILKASERSLIKSSTSSIPQESRMSESLIPAFNGFRAEWKRASFARDGRANFNATKTFRQFEIFVLVKLRQLPVCHF